MFPTFLHRERNVAKTAGCFRCPRAFTKFKIITDYHSRLTAGCLFLRTKLPAANYQLNSNPMKKKFHFLKLNIMSKSLIFSFFCLFFALIGTEAAAQCNPDVNAPTPICINGQTVKLDPGETVVMQAEEFDNASFDNCTSIDFRVEETPVSATPPTTTSLSFNEDGIGQHSVAMWAIDQAGNADYCTVTLMVTNDCGGGNGSQNLACNDTVHVDILPNETHNFYPGGMLEGGPYCSDYTLKLGANGAFLSVLELDPNDVGTHQLTVRDVATGNQCWGILKITTDCNNDTTPPNVICDQGTILVLSNGTATLPANQFGYATDNCSSPLSYFIEMGPVSPTPPNTTSLDFDVTNQGPNDVVLWAVDGAGNAGNCTAVVTVDSCVGSPVMVCNDNIVVEINGPNPVAMYPLDILEGGPYCENQLQLGLFPNFNYADSIVFNQNTVGTYTVSVLNIVTDISCWGTIEVTNNCEFETVQPTAICHQSLTVQLSMDGPDLTTLEAMELDAGSFDNCTATGDLVFAIEQGTQPSPNMPIASTLDFTALGTYSGIWMWVSDLAGNTNNCVVEVTVIPPKCNPDQTPPTIVAPADTVISSDDLAAMNLDVQNFAQLNQYFGNAYAYDYCGLDTVLQSTQSTVNGCNSLKTLVRTFLAIDDAGNVNTAQQVITVVYDFSINIPKDYLPGDPGNPEQLTVVQGNGTFLSVTWEDQVFEYNCDTIPDKIIRTWGVIDWCNVAINQPAFSLPRLDRNADGFVGDAYVTWVKGDSLILLENGLPVQYLGVNDGLMKYTQIIRYNYDDTLQHSVAGTVFIDTIANCSYDAGEIGLVNWKVKAIGQTTGTIYSATTQANGLYEINGICVSDTELELSLDVPFNYGQNCSTTWTVQTIPNIPAVQNIPVNLDDECALMMVDLATPFLRRCFPNTYIVSYGNYSSQPIADAWVEVALDTFMDFQNSSLPAISLGGNTYKFEVGTLGAGQSGGFSINFDLSCDAELGQTHCTEAHIFPDTLCPQNANWSGANIVVEGNCVNDEVHLTIKNTGTGNMTAPLDFIVVEDVIMYMQGDFNLGAGQSQQLLPIPASGETWRLEAEQVPSHPYPGNVSITLEGCNGLNMTGLVNLFPTENPNPFITVDCQANIGAFDPNDKSATPAGYGSPHFIERNTDIEYLIRFQNAGTDTAFTVVILDSLSQYLDPTTIRPGVGSHPFSFEILEEKLLRFTFSDIMLPDSNINEAASHGFVQFVAKQKPDLVKNTVIENTAAIYFDFNEPVITNTVFHAIGENFIEVSDAKESNGLAPLKVFPNPASDAVTFSLPIALGENANFQLHDQLGKLVHNQPVSGEQFRFERKGMAPGIYFYSIENEGLKLYSGKVILR